MYTDIEFGIAFALCVRFMLEMFELLHTQSLSSLKLKTVPSCSSSLNSKHHALYGQLRYTTQSMQVLATVAMHKYSETEMPQYIICRFPESSKDFLKVAGIDSQLGSPIPGPEVPVTYVSDGPTAVSVCEFSMSMMQPCRRCPTECENVLQSVTLEPGTVAEQQQDDIHSPVPDGEDQGCMNAGPTTRPLSSPLQKLRNAVHKLCFGENLAWQNAVALSAAIISLVAAAVSAAIFTVLGSNILSAVFTCIVTLLATALVLGYSFSYYSQREASIKAGLEGRHASEYLCIESAELEENFDKMCRPLAMSEIAWYNILIIMCDKKFCLSVQKRLQMRALNYAKDTSEFKLWGIEAETDGYSVYQVSGMVKQLKKYANKKLLARRRWLWLLGFSILCGYVLTLPALYSCFFNVDQARDVFVAWVTSFCIVVFNASLIIGVSLAEDAAALAPPGSMGLVALALMFGAGGQVLFINTVSSTDICLHVRQLHFRPLVILFCALTGASITLAARMFAGKLLDYCELRIELLTINQPKTVFTPESGLWKVYQIFKLCPKTAELSPQSNKRLSDLSNVLWERWSIGLGVLILGLAPAVLKTIFAMWQGPKHWEDVKTLESCGVHNGLQRSDQTLWDILPEMILSSVGTTAVLIVLLLSDKDLTSWLRVEDLKLWSALALCTMFAQVTGAVVGVLAASHSCDPQGLTLLLGLVLLCVTLQFLVSVWGSLELDLKLIMLFCRGHEYVPSYQYWWREYEPNAESRQAEDSLIRRPVLENEAESVEEREVRYFQAELERRCSNRMLQGIRNPNA